jgi:hypothetical protein
MSAVRQPFNGRALMVPIYWKPFLNPVPPPSPNGDTVAMILVPIRYLVGALRILLSLAIALIYFILVDVVSSAFVRELAGCYKS